MTNYNNRKEDSQMNPFKHGQIVTGDDFCGRDDELKILHERIETGQNVVLMFCPQPK